MSGDPAAGDSGIVWRPDDAIRQAANLTAFMRAHAIADYDALNRRSVAEPEWFWNAHRKNATENVRILKSGEDVYLVPPDRITCAPTSGSSGP